MTIMRVFGYLIIVSRDFYADAKQFAPQIRLNLFFFMVVKIVMQVVISYRKLNLSQ